MQTYLYGLILTRNARLIPAHVTGIDGSGVRVLECGDLAALVSGIDRPVARTLEDVRAHDHALQAIVHHGATAAAGRFGQSFANDHAARAHVIEHGTRIAGVLAAWDGCVEMRLLVPGEVEQPPATVPENVGAGRAYLERVRAQRASVDQLGLREALGPVVRAERVEPLSRGRGVAFCHLIERTAERAYRDAVALLPALAPATLVGPLALHTFAEPE